MQRANKNTRYTQLSSLESVTQVIQVIVTRQLITQVTLSRGLNRQERRLTQATSSRGIGHVTGASNNLQLKVSSRSARRVVNCAGVRPVVRREGNGSYLCVYGWWLVFVFHHHTWTRGEGPLFFGVVKSG